MFIHIWRDFSLINIISFLIGVFQVKPDKKATPDAVMAKKLGMIAGGTGITPMLQLVRAIFKDKTDNSEISLLFANQVFVKIQKTNS